MLSCSSLIAATSLRLYEALELLFSAGFDGNMLTNDGESALDIALAQCDTIAAEVLRENGVTSHRYAAPKHCEMGSLYPSGNVPVLPLDPSADERPTGKFRVTLFLLIQYRYMASREYQ